MAEAGDRVCRTESLRSANEHAVRRRGTRCWRGGVACVLAGVQWNEGGLMCRRSLCVRPSEVPRFTDALPVTGSLCGIQRGIHITQARAKLKPPRAN